MSSDNLSDRDVAGILNIPINELRLGGYSDELYDKIIVKGLREISERKVYHLDTTESPLTTTKILNGGMEIKLRFGLSLIVVDYLGILADEYGRNQYERVGYISRTIKQIARVLDVPIMALHQLSRNLEYQQDKRPQLKDLRDSGNLEEDADNVLFLYRDSYYEENPESKTTEVILAKQRQGDSGNRRKIELVFDENKKIYREVYYG
jgi:replicative DNA helicase